MAKVSVIVPIYNAEKYLEHCLYSIITQTLKNIEIILINDGSTDSSPAICDKYAELDNRIKVIHKNNEGMGKTYNLGVEIAQGDYIGFVESDDWIEPNMYELLYKNALENDSDLVKCGLFYSYDANTDKIPFLEEYILNTVSNTKQPFTILENKSLVYYHSSVWATLYKSEFVKQLKFSEEPDASYQDFSFMIKALVKAKKISVVNQYLYHWQIGNNGSSINRHDDKLMRMLDQVILVKDFLQKENMLEQLFSEFYKQAIISLFNFYNAIDKEYQQEFFIKLNNFFSDINSENFIKATKFFNNYQIRFLKYIQSGNYDVDFSFYEKKREVFNFFSQDNRSIVLKYHKNRDIVTVNAGNGWALYVENFVYLFFQAFARIRKCIIKDFDMAIALTDNIEDMSNSEQYWGVGTAKKEYYDRLIPSPFFVNWKNCHINDYDEACKEIFNEGQKDPIYNTCFWSGNINTHISRAKLYNEFSSNPKFVLNSMTWKDNNYDLIATPSSYISMSEQTKYRYIIDIRGNGWSGRLPYTMFSNRPIFYIERGPIAYFERDLKPFVHYIPVKEDLSNLEQMYDWAENNYTEAKQIAKNALEYAQIYLTSNAVVEYYSKKILEHANTF